MKRAAAEYTSPGGRQAGPFLWWCGSCRRAEPFGDADLERFGRAGWPECCGRKVFCAANKGMLTSDSQRRSAMLPAHLLVVDDRPDSLNLTCCALRAAGLEVTGYTSPSHALAAVSRGRFDLLFSVVELPNMGGADLLEAARAADPRLVGILVTGEGSREVEERAASAGAIELLRRPFRVQDLFGAVERALGLPRRSLAMQAVPD